jgi:hypothetical protein
MPRVRDERGSALVLALIFVVAMGGIILALATFTSNSMLTTTNVRAQRTVLNDAETATVTAMQSLRSNFYGTEDSSGSLPGQGITGAYLGPNTAVSCFPNTVTPAGGGNAGGPVNLPSSNPQRSGSSVSLYCTGNYNPTSPATRVVDFYACRANVSGAVCIAPGSTQVVLHAQVSYNDFSTAGQNACGPNYNPNATPPMVQTCGTAMTVNTWDIYTADS